MDKLRFPLALLLSLLVLTLWTQYFGPPPPAEQPAAVQEGDGGAEGAAAPDLLPGEGEGESVGERTDELERWQEWLELGEPGAPGHYQVLFDNRGGSVAELRLGNYTRGTQLEGDATRLRENLEPLLLGLEDGKDGPLRSFVLRTSNSSGDLTSQDLADVHWQHEVLRSEDGRALGVTFRFAPGTGVVFSKTLRSVPGRHELEWELAVHSTNPEHVGQPRQFSITPAAVVPRASEDSFYIEPKAVSARLDGSEVRLSQEESKESSSELEGSFPSGSTYLFAGVHNKYFAALLRGADEDSTAAIQGVNWRRALDPELVRTELFQAAQARPFMVTDLDIVLRVAEPGDETASRRFLVYAGPKERETMVEDFPAHAKLIEEDLGFFSGIAKLLLGILGFFHGIFGNWGWAIIFLTLTVRGALFPLTRRSQTAMAKHQTKMKRVQPKLDELKVKYEKDPTKLRQEQARIMQEEGAFPPLGGCLPLFFQFPIFIGLFQALRTSFDMRQAPFMLWIEDLSAPDRLLRMDLQLPLIGTIEYLNILPILMVVLWILQQKVMPKPTDEQALRMQKMMMWMPIMFGFFLYNYAAGLSLYMVTTSTFGILEQTVIKKIWPLDTTEKPKKKNGLMKRMMELSEQAQRVQEMQRQQKAAGGGGNRAARRSNKKR